MNELNLVEQFRHITNVLLERVALYEKRQLETKRAIKAMHRGDIKLEPLTIHYMLEAHVSYFINKIGINTIEEFLNSQDFHISDYRNLESFFTSSNELIDLFSEILINSQSLPMQDKYVDEITIILFEAVFSYNEDIQRQKISKYLKYSHKNLIHEIFKKIVILDDKYTSSIILALENFYAKA
ncbi:MAG: hypothetical protein FK730_08420 [Asgard group archaeon]|nr:hypothetical protein [Asgard group archaeon]